jgi:hypothetical protein
MSISPIGGTQPVHTPAPAGARAEGREAPGVKDNDGDSDRGAASARGAVRAPGTLNVRA